VIDWLTKLSGAVFFVRGILGNQMM
jgi:hypothetical protein